MFSSLAGRTPELIDFCEYRKYALAIPIVEKDGKACIVFEVRAKTLDRQPGEVCLPGGSVEAGETFSEASLRETSEELNLPMEQIKMVAPMDIYLSPSGQWIAPYLVRLERYDGSFCKDEVDHVFYVPVEFFINHEPEAYVNRIYTEPAENFPLDRIPGGKCYPWYSGRNSVYFYPEYEGHLIWGLTAKIMKSAAEIMKEALKDGK